MVIIYRYRPDCACREHQVGNDNKTLIMREFSYISRHKGYIEKQIFSTCLFSHQLCLTLCDPMDCSKPCLPGPHHLPKFAQVHVHCIGDSASAAFFSFCPQSFPESGYFPMRWLFTSGDQNTGVSASGSVLPMNIQKVLAIVLSQ